MTELPLMFSYTEAPGMATHLYWTLIGCPSKAAVLYRLSTDMQRINRRD